MQQRRWYAVVEDNVVELFDSESDARDAAAGALESARDESGDDSGWPEWTDAIEWGEITPRQESQQFNYRERPDTDAEDWPNPAFDFMCDYRLVRVRPRRPMTITFVPPWRWARDGHGPYPWQPVWLYFGAGRGYASWLGVEITYG